MNSFENIARIMWLAVPRTKLSRKLVASAVYRWYKKNRIPEKEVTTAEGNWSEKEKVVVKYKKKWRRISKKTKQAIEQLLERAPVYKERTDKDRLRTDILFCRLAYGFMPFEYLCYGLEEKDMVGRLEYLSDCDKMLHFIKLNSLLDIDVLKEKHKTSAKFSDYYKRDVIKIGKPKDFNSFQEFTKKHHEFVKKPIGLSSGSGRSIAFINMDGRDKRECFNDLISSGKPVVLEERVIQSKTMAAFNSTSVNTVRCIAFHTKDGIILPYALFKTGRNGAFVDNAGNGGLVTGVDSQTGIVDTDGYSEFGERIEKHPDSGLRYKGFQLPDWEQMLRICTEMLNQLPEIKFISWDLAHTEDGWVVIEGNAHGALFGMQLVYERSFKKEIEEIMRNTKTIIK